MKKQQKGAALFVVMALLSASMVVGMSTMQSSLVDERLAGNFRSSVQAKMTAENTLSSLVNPVNTANRNDFLGQLVANPQLLEETEGKLTGDAIAPLLQAGMLDQFIEDLLPANFDELDEDEQRQIKEELLANLELQFEVNTEEQTVTITSRDIGLRNSAARDSSLVYSYRYSGGTEQSSPFESAIVGCEGVTVDGGSTISSYRSSDGAWSGQPGSFATSDQPLISTTAENANVDLIGGDEQVHGGVFALGGLTLNGSSQVFGDIFANQAVRFNGGGVRVRGDVESLADIIFTKDASSRVDGAVRTEEDVQINNWSASIGEGIYAGGRIITDRNPPNAHVDQLYRDNFYQNTSPGLNPLLASGCDTFDFFGNSLEQELQRYQHELTTVGDVVVGAWPNREWRITPEKIERFDLTWNVNKWVEVAHSEESTLLDGDIMAYRLNNLELVSNPTLRISGGDVLLVIDNDLISLDGAGPGFVIDADSSLTIMMGGRALLKNNIKMSTTSTLSTTGKPTLSIFSSYENNSVGIDINASNRVVANVYAPFTQVSVNSGGSLFGSVKAREVTVVGGAKIVYDELLANAFGENSGEPSPEWCSFDDLSPLTIASPVGRLSLPNSQAEFNGKGSVPDITVPQGDLERFSGANAANDNIQGGIPDGLFSRGESAEKFHAFIEMIRTRSDTVQVQGGSVRNNTAFGSKGNEQITFVNGAINANNISGAGVLVVKGNYDAGGNPEFDGLIIVLGNYSQKGGGGRDLNGALLVAPYNASDLTFASANIEFSGGGSNDFNYDEAALRTAFNLLNDEEQASWGSCNAPPASGNGELTWSLSGWR